MPLEVKVKSPTRSESKPDRSVEPAFGPFGKLPVVALCLVLLACAALVGFGQQAESGTLRRPIVIPNRPLDPHELNEMAEKNKRNRSYEAANLARKQQIDEETAKLLILARDLKAKADSLGDNPATPMMLREAAMIEFLANDVKEKMKLVVTAE